MAETLDGMAEAERRIAEEATRRTGRLDLRSLGLARLPEALFGLTHLRTLDLGTEPRWRGESRPNAVRAQAVRLAGLARLEVLDVSGSDLADLAPMASLMAIQTLDCSSTGVADLAPLQGLANFQTLHCSRTPVADLAPLQGLANFQTLDCSGTQVADLAPLQGLANLQTLDCSDTGVADLAPLQGLANLQTLHCFGTPVADLAPLQGLANLQTLDCSGTPVADLAPLQGLANLQSLHCSGTEVADLTPLQGLANLQSLHCWNTPVADLAPLQGLANFQTLDCSGTEVADLAPLQGLANLHTLHCSDTGVADLAPLQGLANLQTLHCFGTPVADLAPLQGLANLQTLDCSGTPVADLAPLQGLANLQSLHCSGTEVADLTPLQGLANLQSLHCWNTPVADLAPLQGLANLQTLDCSGTEVADLAPLQGLANLRALNASGCRLRALPVTLVHAAALRRLILFESTLAGIPAAVLSQAVDDNCLDAVRAHLADEAAGAAALTDVKLLILGNGRAGKTQLCRRLHGQPFETAWNSTHGVQIRRATLPGSGGQPDVTLHLWDFGGQDIYHGTHALFLRHAGAFVIAWSTDTDNSDPNPHQGLQFRNHPLGYWVAHVQHQARAESPVLIVQTKCDTLEDESRALPLPPAIREALPPHWQVLHHSAASEYGDGALLAALRKAVRWQQDPARLGVTRIGTGRLHVLHRLEAMREADQALPPADRRHRLLTRAAFLAICEEARSVAGTITSPAALLAFLHNAGVVFHQPGLFGDAIVLDQGWALDAIYAVFERASSLQHIRRHGGRFYRSDLAGLVWQDHGEAEQRVFLGMMEACGVCFLHHRAEDARDEDRYIAPDLLPDRAAVADVMEARWPADATAEEVEALDYAFLHGALIRALIARVGRSARIDAHYWRDGVTAYEKTTRSHLLIEQAMTGQWQGTIRLRTRGGDAARLLDMLIAWVEEAQTPFGLAPRQPPRRRGRDRLAAVPVVPDAGDVAAPLAPIFGRPPTAPPEWYVSYAWDRADTPDEQRTNAVVDRLCRDAQARNQPIRRDQDEVRTGESLRSFMGRLGHGDRIFIIMNEGYLRRENCVGELIRIWRASHRDPADFLRRVRVLVTPGTRIWSSGEKVDWAKHWKHEFDRVDADARAHGALLLGDEGVKLLDALKDYYSNIVSILTHLSGVLQARTLEQLEQWGFDDPPP